MRQLLHCCPHCSMPSAKVSTSLGRCPGSEGPTEDRLPMVLKTWSPLGLCKEAYVQQSGFKHHCETVDENLHFLQCHSVHRSCLSHPNFNRDSNNIFQTKRIFHFRLTNFQNVLKFISWATARKKVTLALNSPYSIIPPLC